MTFGSSFWKKGSVYPHTLMYITMIAKVCDRESRQDSWFENRLVCFVYFVASELSKDKQAAAQLDYKNSGS